MEYKYKLYQMRDGKTYLSSKCPCNGAGVKLTDKEIKLVKKARELDNSAKLSPIPIHYS